MARAIFDRAHRVGELAYCERDALTLVRLHERLRELALRSAAAAAK